MRRTFVLLILDGWGIGQKDQGNPIHTERPRHINYIRQNYKAGSLQASGIAVGLPWEEEGNSEVGHLTIGAGKVIYQHFPRITMAIQDGTFQKNSILHDAFAHAKQNSSAVNIVGLLSEGNVHASIEHLNALIAMAKQEGASPVHLHLFADGEDSKPQSVLSLIKRISGGGKDIGTISGRYYAMDRDNHWERTRNSYDAITGEKEGVKNSVEERIAESYSRQPNDQFIEPFVVDPQKTIRDNDALIFFNFREDRMRQIARPFIDTSFREFTTRAFSNLYVCTFTKYSDELVAPVAFPVEPITMTLGDVLADNDLTQLRIAESEKYPHITYFFNGYREEAHANEYRILIPSRNEPHPERHPEMRTREIIDRAIQAIEEHSFDFILINIANSDIIAHTGNIDAARKAVTAIDEHIGRIGKSVIENNALLMITSDHGNIEHVIESASGIPQTRHDPNPVPVYLIGREHYKEKTAEEAERAEHQNVGILSDVAPTILNILGIPKPEEMTGENFLHLLS